MGDKGSVMVTRAIETSSSSETDIDVCSPSSEEEGTPRRPMFCLKNKADMKEVEEREDCFILDFDPYDDSLHTFKLPVSKDLGNADSPRVFDIILPGFNALREIGDKGYVMVSRAIETSSSSETDIDIDVCSPSSEEEGTPRRPIFCLKNKADMKEVEEREDCFILDFDPYDDSLHPSKLPVFKDLGNADSPRIFDIILPGFNALREMGDKGNVMMSRAIETSSSSETDTDIDVCSPASEEEGTPLRSIFVLKNKADMKEVEEKEDCFILDFDPDDPLPLSKLSVSKDLGNADSPDLFVIAEKGQVACRDYPHSRHVCVKYPFENSPHESYCELCYCYVCDLAAPCIYWSSGTAGHCHAIDKEAWKFQRRAMREILHVRN